VNGDHGDGPADDEEPVAPHQVVVSSLVLHALLVIVALGWLYARDRTEAVAELAIGERGPWFGLLAGVVAGIAFHGLVGAIAARTKALAGLDADLRGVFAGIDVRAADATLLVAALGEEFLLRCAAQDAFGWPAGVAVTVALVIASRHRRLWLLAVVYASMLGLLVECGFGLLGSSVANVVVNHLNLRRLS